MLIGNFPLRRDLLSKFLVSSHPTYELYQPWPPVAIFSTAARAAVCHSAFHEYEPSAGSQIEIAFATRARYEGALFAFRKGFFKIVKQVDGDIGFQSQPIKLRVIPAAPPHSAQSPVTIRVPFIYFVQNPSDGRKLQSNVCCHNVTNLYFG